MSKEKQIEKMTCSDCVHYNICSLWSTTDLVEDEAHKHCHGKFTHYKGYRKAADVALEVLNAIMSKVQIMVSSIKAQEEIGNITEFNGGAKTALEIVFKDLAELKKKYTEGSNAG